MLVSAAIYIWEVAICYFHRHYTIQKNEAIKLNNIISKLFFASTILFGSAAYAAPYSMIYTGTINASEFGAEAVDGEPYTVELILDNGGTSALNQTWTSADLQCVVWTMNTAANETVSIDYSGANTLSTETGNITTDAAGTLLTVQTEWNDDNGYATGDLIGDTFADTTGEWYLNGGNGVFHTPGWVLTMSDLAVANNIDPAFWTNPVAEIKPFCNNSNVTPSSGDGGAVHPLWLILSGLLGALRLRARSKR